MKPTIRERLREKICPNCGGKVERKSKRGPPPTFCGKACKRAMNNRLLGEGQTIIGLLKAWRVDRGQGEIATTCFAQAIEALDLHISRDREANRPRPDYYGATIVASGTRYFDRERPKQKGERESEETV
jgi:endogenous inhibitor of DNA gyrase (YacG/DUF329 family)